MGLPISHSSFHRPFTPPPIRSTPNNATRLATWLTLQSPATKSNITAADISHFHATGTFPPRPITAHTPATLRFEIHDASTAHLFPGIRRPHFDVHSSAAKTLGELVAVLRRNIPNLPSIASVLLTMNDHSGIESNPPMEMYVSMDGVFNWDSAREMYAVWWMGQFETGRNGLVCVKVKTA